MLSASGTGQCLFLGQRCWRLPVFLCLTEYLLGSEKQETEVALPVSLTGHQAYAPLLPDTDIKHTLSSELKRKCLPVGV